MPRWEPEPRDIQIVLLSRDGMNTVQIAEELSREFDGRVSNKRIEQTLAKFANWQHQARKKAEHRKNGHQRRADKIARAEQQRIERERKIQEARKKPPKWLRLPPKQLAEIRKRIRL